MFHTNLVRYMRIKEKTPKDFYSNKDPRLNISKSQFFKLRRGDDYPQTETLRKIAKVLGVQPETLLLKSDDGRTSPYRKRKLGKFAGLDCYVQDTLKHDEKEKKEAPDDFDKFFDEEFEPAFKEFLNYHERREFRERVKFGLICICGFIAVSACFAMLFVALQS